jgi:hypothetical protein
VSDPVERYKELLSTEQRERILGECEELHVEALGLVGPRTGRAENGSEARGLS